MAVLFGPPGYMPARTPRAQGYASTAPRIPGMGGVKYPDPRAYAAAQKVARVAANKRAVMAAPPGGVAGGWAPPTVQNPLNWWMEYQGKNIPPPVSMIQPSFSQGFNQEPVIPAYNWTYPYLNGQVVGNPEVTGQPAQSYPPQQGQGQGQQQGQAQMPAWVGTQTGMTPQQYAAWYAAFQGQHEGQTPQEYYGQPGQNYTGGQGYSPSAGLGQALDDLTWSQGFAAEHGHAPNDTDWQVHWYQTHDNHQVPEWLSPPREQGPQQAKWYPPPVYWR